MCPAAPKGRLHCMDMCRVVFRDCFMYDRSPFVRGWCFGSLITKIPVN